MTVRASQNKGAFETIKTVSGLLCFEIQLFLTERGGWDKRERRQQQQKMEKTCQWRKGEPLIGFFGLVAPWHYKRYD